MKRNLIPALTAFFIMSFCFPALARQTRDDVLSQFVVAGVSYKDGKYEEAAKILEGLLSNGLHSGNIYYNLGNCYVKAGHLGKAVLSYERAKRLIPRDSDLNANLRYALSLVKNGGYEGERSRYFMATPLDALGGLLTKSEMAGFLAILFIMMGAFHLASLYLSFSKNMVRYGMAGVLVMLVFLSAGFIYKAQLELHSSIVIQDTASYFEPRDDATVHYELYEGMKISIVERASSWLKVKRGDGKMGWVKSSALEEI